MSVLLRRYYQLLDSSSGDWLRPATRRAIMAAFGNEGAAVIKATNAYLNGIARTDQTKATALAGFVNEDPMMVCSLGLEPQGVTMPVRWLVATGGAYINIGIKPFSGAHIKCKCRKTTTTNDWLCFGSRVSGNTKCLMFQVITNTGDKRVFYGFGSTTGTISNKYSTNDLIDVEIKDSTHQMILNGTSYTISAIEASEYEMTMNRINTSGLHNNGADSDWQFFEIEGVANMIPSKHNGQCGMYDIERKTWFGNAGTGQFTIPDISYTPTH